MLSLKGWFILINLGFQSGSTPPVDQSVFHACASRLSLNHSDSSLKSFTRWQLWPQRTTKKIDKHNFLWIFLCQNYKFFARDFSRSTCSPISHVSSLYLHVTNLISTRYFQSGLEKYGLIFHPPRQLETRMKFVVRHVHRNFIWKWPRGICTCSHANEPISRNFIEKNVWRFAYTRSPKLWPLLTSKKSTEEMYQIARIVGCFANLRLEKLGCGAPRDLRAQLRNRFSSHGCLLKIGLTSEPNRTKVSMNPEGALNQNCQTLGNDLRWNVFLIFFVILFLSFTRLYICFTHNLASLGRA